MTFGGFTARTVGLLTQVGWSRSRNVDISTVTTCLRSEGYEVLEAVERFLAVFYGLTISYPYYKDPTVVDQTHFDAILAAQDVFPEHVASWEKRVSQSLCPIGEAFRGNMTLVMSETGVVYAGRDAELFRVGPSGEDAIEILCAGEELRSLD